MQSAPAPGVVYQQPQAHINPVVMQVNTEKQVHNHIHGKREWDKGLIGFDPCWTCGNRPTHFCISCCCPSLGIADILTRIGYTPFSALAAGAVSFSVCCMPSCCNQCMVYLVRNEFRTTYGYKGHWCKDFLAAFCCMNLTIAQMAFQLNKMGERERLIKFGHENGGPSGY